MEAIVERRATNRVAAALALENTSGEVVDRDRYVACRVEFHGQPATIQLTTSHARRHDDAVTLWWPKPDEVSPDGELFFEIADDNFYKLYPV